MDIDFEEVYTATQQETILDRLTKDYFDGEAWDRDDVFEIFYNGDDADKNTLVLGVLTQLQNKKVLLPGHIRTIQENLTKHVKTEHIGYTIQSFFNSNSKKGDGYGAKFKKILGQDVDRRVFIERNVGATRQCEIVQELTRSDLPNECWICRGECTKSTQGGGSPPAKRRRVQSKLGKAYAADRMAEEEEARKVAADAAECGSPQCEHILPVCSGLMFLELASTLTTVASSNVKELAKLEYRWSHSLCNNKKSDIPLINLDIKRKGNYFQIDQTACADLSSKINEKIQENSALYSTKCNVTHIMIIGDNSLAERQELNDITVFLNTYIVKANIDKVLALAFLKLVFASNNLGNLRTRPKKRGRNESGGGASPQTTPVDIDIFDGYDDIFKEFDKIVYGVAGKIQRAKRGIGKLPESFWISENLKNTPSIYWQELEKTTKSSISSSPSEQRRSANRKYGRTALSFAARTAKSTRKRRTKNKRTQKRCPNKHRRRKTKRGIKCIRRYKKTKTNKR